MITFSPCLTDSNDMNIGIGKSMTEQVNVYYEYLNDIYSVVLSDIILINPHSPPKSNLEFIA